MEDQNRMKKSITNQVWICTIANTVLLSSGMSLGFTAIALPFMQQDDSPLQVDEYQSSWIASLASIATPVGCLLSGHILDRVGRRAALLLIVLPMVPGWLLIGLWPSLWRVYLGRVLTGIGVGLSSIPATVYTAEVTDSSIRGLMVVGTSVSIAGGVVIVYIMGALLKSQWQTVALVSAGFPVVTATLVYFLVPESPVWLVAKNRLEAASAALVRINRASGPAEVKEELQSMAERALKSQKRSLALSTTLKALTLPVAYKPLIIMNVFFFFQQISGTFVIIFYAVDVVQAAGVQTDPLLVTVLIGLTRLIFTVFAAYLSKRLGRRPTAVLSGVGMSLALLTLATHLLMLPPTTAPPTTTVLPPSPLFENGTEFRSAVANTTQMSATPEDVSFLPLTCLLFYMLASTIGFLTLPWSMIGEVYSDQIRGFASGLTTCLAYIVSFVVLKMYPLMKDVLQKHGVFYFYGIMSLLGTLFVFLCLPETEGKTLQEIELQFMKTPSGIHPEEEVALQNSKKATIVKSPQR